jgi:uncharacterized membrane protein YidH (DUF202 family)
MVWQDTALSIINFGFILTLIPAIIQNYKNRDVKGQSLATYVSTAVLLSIMAYLFLTLDLLLSSLATAGTAVTWYILLYQKISYS